MVGDLYKGGHDEQVAGRVEDVLELVGRIHDGRHAVPDCWWPSLVIVCQRLCPPDDAGVTSMESEAAVEHIQEQLDLLRVSKVACHCLKHPDDDDDVVDVDDDVDDVDDDDDDVISDDDD